MDLVHFAVMGTWLFCHFLGYFGAALIAYAAIAAWTQKAWEPVEQWAPFISNLLTLVGAVLVACSVYYPLRPPRPPWQVSSYVISPVVILFGLIAIYFLAKRVLPQTAVSGFGLLAIAGAILRSLPYPVESP